jgi:hypothetical protein
MNNIKSKTRKKIPFNGGLKDNNPNKLYQKNPNQGLRVNSRIVLSQ